MLFSASIHNRPYALVFTDDEIDGKPHANPSSSGGSKVEARGPDPQFWTGRLGPHLS